MLRFSRVEKLVKGSSEIEVKNLINLFRFITFIRYSYVIVIRVISINHKRTGGKTSRGRRVIFIYIIQEKPKIESFRSYF